MIYLKRSRAPVISHPGDHCQTDHVRIERETSDDVGLSFTRWILFLGTSGAGFQGWVGPALSVRLPFIVNPFLGIFKRVGVWLSKVRVVVVVGRVEKAATIIVDVGGDKLLAWITFLAVANSLASHWSVGCLRRLFITRQKRLARGKVL